MLKQYSRTRIFFRRRMAGSSFDVYAIDLIGGCCTFPMFGFDPEQRVHRRSDLQARQIFQEQSAAAALNKFHAHHIPVLPTNTWLGKPSQMPLDLQGI